MTHKEIFSLFRGLARPDSAGRVTAFLASLPKEDHASAYQQIRHYLRKESLRGLNEIGAYFLSLPDKEIIKTVNANVRAGAGLSLGDVLCLAKHDGDRAARLFPEWLGISGELPTLGSSLIRSLVRELLAIDPVRYAHMAGKAKPDPWDNRSRNISLPMSAVEFEARMASALFEPYREEIAAMAKPCLRLLTMAATGPVPNNCSKFGGLPAVQASFVWPTTTDGRPMVFIARLCENDLRSIDPTFRGCLLFFADMEDYEDQGAVFHIEDENAVVPPTLPDDLYRQLIECEVQVTRNYCLPMPKDNCEAWRFPSALFRDHQAMRELKAMRLGAEGEAEGLPLHVAFGYPHPSDNEVKYKAESQLTRFKWVNGEFQNAKEIYRNTARWITLLSTSTDETAVLTFRDTGTLTFVMTEDDFKARDFSRIVIDIDYA